MNNTFSNAVGTIKGLNHFGSECIHSIVWYRFIFIAALVYYTMALLSMIFAKESRLYTQYMAELSQHEFYLCVKLRHTPGH